MKSKIDDYFARRFRTRFYLDLNEDLQSLDYKNLKIHWRTYGRKEGRLAALPLVFQINSIKRFLEAKMLKFPEYLIANPDLTLRNRSEAQLHWYKHGSFENRPRNTIDREINSEIISHISNLIGAGSSLTCTSFIEMHAFIENLTNFNLGSLLPHKNETNINGILDLYEKIFLQTPHPSVLNGYIDLSKNTDRLTLVKTMLKSSLNSFDLKIALNISTTKPRINRYRKLNLLDGTPVRYSFRTLVIFSYFVNFFYRYLLRKPKSKSILEVVKPKISIISSIYNGDAFINQFLENLTSLDNFHECELLLIDANSPGNEYKVIKKYLDKFPNNISYTKCDERISIYEAWNLGVRMAKGEYLTNANLDDQRISNGFAEQVQILNANQDLDVVYGDSYYSFIRNISLDAAIKMNIKTELPRDPQLLYFNSPHCAPMWRANIHDEIGYFDETFKSAADWEFWLRAHQNEFRFMKIDEPTVVYYLNPKGISTASDTASFHEQFRIRERYRNLLLA